MKVELKRKMCVYARKFTLKSNQNRVDKWNLSA